MEGERRTLQLWEAEPSEMIVELRRRLEQCTDAELSRFGMQLIDLGSEAVAMMHTRDVKGAIPRVYHPPEDAHE